MSEQQKQMNPLGVPLHRKDEWNENAPEGMFDDEMRGLWFEVMNAEWKKFPPCAEMLKDPLISDNFIFLPLNRVRVRDDLKELLVEKKKAGEHIIGVSYTKFPFKKKQ